jgi:hypothetical protein
VYNMTIHYIQNVDCQLCIPLNVLSLRSDGQQERNYNDVALWSQDNVLYIF